MLLNCDLDPNRDQLTAHRPRPSRIFPSIRSWLDDAALSVSEAPGNTSSAKNATAGLLSAWGTWLTQHALPGPGIQQLFGPPSLTC